MKYAIALGSNLGDRKHNLKAAMLRIADFAIIKRVSSIYETKALVPHGAPQSWDLNFYNAVILIELQPKRSPLQLLCKLKAIEKSLGRSTNYIKWAPRVIDLDIILAEQALAGEQLTIPHPQFMRRDFVLTPLLEILCDKYAKLFSIDIKQLKQAVPVQNIIRKLND